MFLSVHRSSVFDRDARNVLTPAEPVCSVTCALPAPADLTRRLWVLLLITLFVGFSARLSRGQTIVDRYGQLRVSGNRIVDKNGTAIQLRGMSLYWSQWVPKYYTTTPSSGSAMTGK